MATESPPCAPRGRASPHRVLARGHPLPGLLQAVVDGVAQRVHKGLAEARGDGPVEHDPAPLDAQVNEPSQRVRQVATMRGKRMKTSSTGVRRMPPTSAVRSSRERPRPSTSASRSGRPAAAAISARRALRSARSAASATRNCPGARGRCAQPARPRSRRAPSARVAAGPDAGAVAAAASSPAITAVGSTSAPSPQRRRRRPSWPRARPGSRRGRR